MTDKQLIKFELKCGFCMEINANELDNLHSVQQCAAHSIALLHLPISVKIVLISHLQLANSVSGNFLPSVETIFQSFFINSLNHIKFSRSSVWNKNCQYDAHLILYHWYNCLNKMTHSFQMNREWIASDWSNQISANMKLKLFSDTYKPGNSGKYLLWPRPCPCAFHTSYLPLNHFPLTPIRFLILFAGNVCVVIGISKISNDFSWLCKRWSVCQ